MIAKPAILILVENLPVPLDRRVWQEACALRDAGYTVSVICPQMRGFTEPEEVLEGIHIYRHWISEEAGGFAGFFWEYAPPSGAKPAWLGKCGAGTGSSSFTCATRPISSFWWRCRSRCSSGRR